MRRTRILLSAVVLSLAASACGATGAASPPKPRSVPTITIGAPDSSEQAILANLYADVLHHAGARVTLHTDLGPRQTVEPELAGGQLDLYPDYAGALLLYLDSNDTDAATATAAAVPDLEHLLGEVGATVLDPAPALDTEVFAVTRATAEEYHLTTLSSVKPVASQLVLGGPPGCQTQPQCEVGLQNTYGLHFKSFTSLDDAGPITVSALLGGEVQIAEVYSSDGTIVENNLVALTDDLHLLDADYVIPVIRRSVDTPTVAGALNGLSAQLTTQQLSELNIEVTANGDAPGTVARQWLRQQGLI